MMQVEIRNKGNYANSAVARCIIPPGETINVESGSMYQMSMGIKIDSKMEGGFFGALKRSVLSGDSFFVSKYTAPIHESSWVDICPSYPGDIVNIMNDPSNPIIITRGSWIASDETVKIDSKVSGMTLAIGGEGFFSSICQGRGNIVLAAYGAIDVHELKEGEGFTVDTGHLVAYESSIRCSTRKAGTGLLNSLTSGEGLVMDFFGPGTVITQTRNPNDFAGFISRLLPSK